MKLAWWPFLRLIFLILDTIGLGPSNEGWRSLCTSNTRMQLRDHVMTSEHLVCCKSQKTKGRFVKQTKFSFWCTFGIPASVFFPFYFEQPPSKLDAYTVFHSIPTHRISTIFNCCLLDDSLYLTMPADIHSLFHFVFFLNCPPFESSPSVLHYLLLLSAIDGHAILYLVFTSDKPILMRLSGCLWLLFTCDSSFGTISTRFHAVLSHCYTKYIAALNTNIFFNI